MKLLADWMVVAGQLRRDFGFEVDGRGVIRSVLPAHVLGRPDVRLRNAVVAPGGVDGCALAGLFGAEANAAVVSELGAATQAPGQAGAFAHAEQLTSGADAMPRTPPSAAPFADASGDACANLTALADLAVRGEHTELEVRARAVLRSALRAGITTVALPHLAVQPPALHPSLYPDAARSAASRSGPNRTAHAQDVSHSWQVADALIAAANAVGVRLALLDVAMLRRRPGPATGQAAAALGPGSLSSVLAQCCQPTFEAALAHLDALVHHLLAYKNPRVSWGLLMARPTLWGADALVAVRLRLGHLPMHLLDAGELFDPGSLPHAQKPGATTLVEQAIATGALDACLALVQGDGGRLRTHEASGLDRLGVPLLRPPAAADASACTSSRHGHGWGPASGLLRCPYRAAPWLRCLLAQHGGSVTAPPARTAASALGLHGGVLRPDAWADYVVLRPRGQAALPATVAEMAPFFAADSGGEALQVEEAYVAGASVLADG